MAFLRTNNDSPDEQFAVDIQLIQLEHPEAWEGWIYYKLGLSRGRQIIASLEGSILQKDVDIFCKAMMHGKKRRRDFEPLEPDFSAHIYPQEPDGVGIEIIVDHGRMSGQGYALNGIGIKLVTDDFQVDKFVQDLRDELKRLVAQAKPSK